MGLAAILIFSFIYSSWAGPPAKAAKTAPQSVQAIVSRFHESFVKCPSRIWQDYSWLQRRILFIYPEDSISWLWVPETNEVRAVENGKIPASARTSVYSFLDWEKHSALALNMNDRLNREPDAVFKLAAHEFFHFIAQKDWVVPEANRGTEYPLRWEPRYYRRMLYESLKLAFDKRDPKMISRARFWYEKWRKNFRAEVRRSADGYEGTASYTEIMASAVAQSRCEASDADLLPAVEKEMKEQMNWIMEPDVATLDDEGYAIGSLSSLILRFIVKDADWMKKVELGFTPLQLVMAKVKSEPQIDDPLLLSNYQEGVKAQNFEMSRELEPGIKSLPSRRFARIILPARWLQNNFSPKYFALISAIASVAAMPLAKDHQFVSPDARSRFKVKAGQVVWQLAEGGPCGASQEAVLVPLEGVDRATSSLDLKTNGVSGHLEGDFKTDDQGLVYFCTR